MQSRRCRPGTDTVWPTIIYRFPRNIYRPDGNGIKRPSCHSLPVHSNRKPRIEKNTDPTPLYLQESFVKQGTCCCFHRIQCLNSHANQTNILIPFRAIRTKTVPPFLTTGLNSQAFLSFLESLDVRLLQPLIFLTFT